MSDDHEVKVELVVDDKSSSTLNKVKHGLGEVAKGHEHAAHAAEHHAHAAHDAHAANIGGHGGEHGGGFFGTLQHHLLAGIGMGVGEKLAEGIAEGIHEIPKMLSEAFDEGVKAIEAQRSIAGMLTMTGAKGTFDEVLDDAKLYKESLQSIAIESGTAESTLIGVFDGIAARSNKSAVQVEELTEKIAYAGKAVKGGPEAIAQGFTALEQGMVRARNPIVMMISQAHLLEGNAKSVAKQMMKMTPEKQIELGEKAIEKLANKMKDVTPTFTQLKESFAGMKDFAFESLGEPLVQAAVPAMNELKKYLLSHKDEIALYAHDVAESLVEYGKGTLEFLVELKKIAMGQAHLNPEDIDLTKPGDVVKGATAFFGMAVDGLGQMADDFGKWAMKSNPTGFVAQGAFGASSHAAESQAAGNIKYAADPVFAAQAQKDLAALNELNSKFALSGGKLSQTTIDTYEELQQSFRNAQQMGKEAAEDARQGSTTKLVDLYNQAAKNHDMGLQQYITHLIGGSDQLSKQLVDSGVSIDGGFSEFIRILKASGHGEEGEKLARMKKEAGAKTSAPITNFNGGQTFQIKQDFRDQDPDRIAVIFRQDILQAASSRVDSNRSSTFAF